jgi:nitrogen regulatory protein PII 1
MKMVRAIVRPEAADSIADSLAAEGFIGLTKSSAFGRGKQKGITAGDVHYDELPKTVLMTVVEDDDVDTVLAVIKEGAYTGNFGDGKVFVSPVEAALTVRTGSAGL